MPAPKRVYVHFAQHVGKPARPIVQKDDLVRIGTKIGETDGHVSSAVHAPIAGRVLGLIEHVHPVLGTGLCCLIENQDHEEWESGANAPRDTAGMSREELLAIIRDAGIVGMGGAAFPTHVKLAPPADRKIDTLLVNGCECEPVLTSDHRLMLEYPVGIIEGALLFQRVLDAEKLVFAVEKNKPDAITAFRKEGVKVLALKTRYPQGAEKQLIKAALGRTVPRGGLPMDVGCVVQNVGTCYAAFQAVRFGRPLIERVVTVAGDGIKEPRNLLVRLGTTVQDIVGHCGGYTNVPRQILFGGPMMGVAQYSDMAPIIKGTSGILIRNRAQVPLENDCVRCAHCVDACPMGLMPCEIYKRVKARDFEGARDWGVTDCIECGCCAYECPSDIPLVHYLKFGKAEAQRLERK